MIYAVISMTISVFSQMLGFTSKDATLDHAGENHPVGVHIIVDISERKIFCK